MCRYRRELPWRGPSASTRCSRGKIRPFWTPLPCRPRSRASRTPALPWPAELDATVERVGQLVGDREAEIFRSHRSLLRDPALIGKVTHRILNDHTDAASALRATLSEYTILFEQISDDYIRERLADVRDVVGRLLDHLTFPDRTACLARTNRSFSRPRKFCHRKP